ERRPVSFFKTSLLVRCPSVFRWKGSQFVFFSSSLPVAGPSPPPNVGGVRHGPPADRQPLRCQQCSFTTSRLSHLVRHRRTHTGERPFQCSHCGKGFMQKAHLDAHLRIHTGERPFRCHLCPRAFTQDAGLVSHVRSHTARRSHR
ncbi:uncharacterized protein LOC144145894, partial [Haemaphysalis longicornis]